MSGNTGGNQMGIDSDRIKSSLSMTEPIKINATAVSVNNERLLTTPVDCIINFPKIPINNTDPNIFVDIFIARIMDKYAITSLTNIANIPESTAKAK